MKRIYTILAAGLIVCIAGVAQARPPGPPTIVDAGHGVLLSWSRADDSYIVTEASSLDGPWTPSLAPSFDDRGRKRAVMLASPTAHYFRLSPGFSFVEDFGVESDLSDWTTYWDPGVSRTFEHGGYAVRSGSGGMVIIVPDTRHLTDFAASVDIVYRDENSRVSIGFVAREVDGQANGYSGFAYFAGSQSEAVILNHNEGPPYIYVARKYWTPQPETSYRLQFKGSGSRMTFEVHSGNDLHHPVVEAEAIDDTYTEGELGLIMQWSGDTGMDIRLDNLLLRGTTPTP